MRQKTVKHRRLALLAVVLIGLIAAGAFALFGGKETAAPQEGNLLQNGDFSAVTDGMPDGWKTGMWVTGGASYLEAATLPDGTTAALIENVANNDARFEQTVRVRENATYRLTAKAMAEDCEGGQFAANVSFLGVYGASNTVYDTDGKWEDVTLYARTGKGMDEVTVCVRLGGYGSEATGKAYFTDVELCEVADAPVGVSVLNLATPEPKKEEKPAGEGLFTRETAIPLLLIASAVYLLLAAAIAHACLRPSSAFEDGKTRGAVLPLMLLFGLALRFVLAANVEGYGVDMGCFSAWAGRMATGGPANFYEEGYFCDYPPAYMLVLGAIGWIANLLHIGLSSMGMQVLMKTVPIACDVLLALLVYAAAKKRLGEKPALGLAALTVFSPALLIAGSCWGQIDAVLCVLLVLMLLWAQEGKWRLAIPMFALAVLAKPQAGLLAPLGVAALVKDVREKRSLREIGAGILGALLVTLVIVIPFSLKQQNPLWLVDTYIKTLSSYDYATLSTGNLMFLLGGNWVPGTTVVFGPVTYGALGMALMIASFVFGVLVYMKGEGRGNLFLAAGATLLLVFTLGSKMHERYVLPALILLLLSYAMNRDVRVLAACLLSTAASAANIGAVLAFEHLIAPNLWLGYTVGAAQMIACALTVWAAVDLAFRGHAIYLPVKEEAQPLETDEAAAEYAADVRMRRELLQPRDHCLHMRARDYMIMLTLTAVYAAVGFYNLGATVAPQTGYVSTQEGESVIVDLGEMREDFRIYYYGGISDTGFSFAVSDDGEVWSDENAAFFDRGECFKWQALRRPVMDDGVVTGATGNMLTFSGRYLRVTFDGAASALWEIAAVDAQGNAYPAAGCEAFGARENRADDPEKLIDEIDTVPDKPSYMNSMYFDEIYHGRTGYEHANSLYTYETTHPPLGKVMMSWCISLMGMTPFAWRFAGAVTGVLMIPAIYLLAKQLFGGTLWAFLAAFMMATDCMHFTQTRIATIDSFPVLFIMLMFLFMARWAQMSFYHTKLTKTFVPLALSGVCMGLAIASKWIGCYSAVGLAVMFFARFYSLWRQSVYANEHRDEDERFARAADSFKKNGAITIGMCFVFFVFVPLVIYCLSYIPYLSAYGEVKLNMETIRRLIDAQVYMFDYHKNLVAEHYFASVWYEWPVIAKPMWYYAADYKGAGMASSILAFGNPAVWWTGLAGILFVLMYSVYRNLLPALRVIPGREDDMDRAMPVIVTGFLSAYLPWVLIARLTFIYHYFASVPFIILATAQGLRLLERKNKKLAYGLTAVLCIAALVLFVAFYPLASGMEVPRAWCDAVSWFDNWMWY